jgi:hypothetical protein
MGHALGLALANCDREALYNNARQYGAGGAAR